MGTGGLRILHVISSFDFAKGGPTAALLGMAVSQQRAGLNVCIVSTFAGGADHAAADKAREAGVQVDLVGPARGKLARHPDIKHVLKKRIRDADVIHIHGVYEEIQHQAAYLSRQANKPYVISTHGMISPYVLKHNRLLKAFYMMWRLKKNLLSAAALHHTTPMGEALTKPLDLPVARIIEPLGIHMEEFQELPEPGFLRQRFPEIGNRRIIMFLGLLRRIKGLELLIDAFAQAELKDCVLVLAGPDSAEQMKPKLESRSRELGINESLFFTGMLHGRERIHAMRDADLFVLPSFHENFGVVVVEALATGLPVIVTEDVAMSGFLKKHPKVSRICQTSSESLCSGIKDWLAQASSVEDVSHEARRLAKENFAWDMIGQNWATHYENTK